MKSALPLGEAHENELLKDVYSYVYFESPQGDLAAHFVLPANHNPEASHHPCLVFFHGGLWDSSMPTQFIPHAHHFATRGAVCLTVEYRVFNKHRTNPLEAIEDARMVIGFLKTNAKLIGIDPDRIVLIGAGSGAHVILSNAVLPDAAGDQDIPIDSLKPAAVIGISSIVDTSSKGVGSDLFPSPKEDKASSPTTLLPAKNLPPCLLLHGRQDRVALFEQTERFAKMYRKKGNRCELVDFEGAGHTFFNFNTHTQLYQLALNSIDHYLCNLGFFSPEEPLVF